MVSNSLLGLPEPVLPARGEGIPRKGVIAMARRPKRRERKFVAYFTTRNGRRIYARDYGYQGWPIPG